MRRAFENVRTNIYTLIAFVQPNMTTMLILVFSVCVILLAIVQSNSRREHKKPIVFRTFFFGKSSESFFLKRTAAYMSNNFCFCLCSDKKKQSPTKNVSHRARADNEQCHSNTMHDKRLNDMHCTIYVCRGLPKLFRIYRLCCNDELPRVLVIQCNGYLSSIAFFSLAKSSGIVFSLLAFRIKI